MTEFLYIVLNVSLPIILLISAGYVFQKIFKTDVGTMSKLSIYLFVPVLIFIKFYESDIGWDFLFYAFIFMLLLQVSMYIVALVLSAVSKYNRSTRSAVANALVLMNIGNYGIPLIELEFSKNVIAMASQISIIVMQNLTTSTFSVFQVSSGQSVPRKQAFKSMIKMPAIYAFLLVVILKLFGLKLPDPIKIPFDYINSAFVAVAVLTLGMQLAEVRLGARLKDVLIVSIIKIISTPLAAFGIVLLLGIKGVLAPALVIGVSTPTAVNTAILAREFGNESEFAAQIVLVTTIICTFTLPLVIMFIRWYFPVW